MWPDGGSGRKSGAIFGLIGCHVGALGVSVSLNLAAFECLFAIAFLGIAFQHIFGRKRVALGSANMLFLLEGS